jgi:hypothetical protein
MKVLDYKLNTWSFFDLIMLKVSIFANQAEEERRFLKDVDLNQSKPAYLEDSSSKQLKNLEEICSFLSKFALYDY